MKDIAKLTENCIQWIRDWFDENGPTCNAIIGISGGKDSTIVAKLCVEALGADRVIGVAMPDEGQSLNDADKICEHLGIKFIIAPINGITSAVTPYSMHTTQAFQNVPPRARMIMLYAISQTNNGRVIGTTNLSEFYIGYLTRYGDGGTDVEPIGNLTVTEVLEIGDYLGLPYEWVHKTPDDGLPHSSPDEEKLGFTYKELDEYIRNGVEPEKIKLDKIIQMHKKNLFKETIPLRFNP